MEAVKYIHKYIYKGHDHTTLEFQDDQNRNEVKEYLDSRYIGSVESCWHMFEFSMHAESPTVYRLPVHLEDQHLVYFNPDDNVDDVLERGGNKMTPLTAWFKINESDPAARTTTYQNFPEHFVYDTKKKEWKHRQQGFAIGRMYFAAPSSGERFYLRTLLTVKAGATSFADLRKVHGIQYDTFKEACNALGLLEDDREWRECLTEAGVMQTGPALRKLFTTILFHCNPAEPAQLWNDFKHQICDDLLVKLRNLYQNRDFDQNEVYDYGLHLIDHILHTWGKSLRDFGDMPQVIGDWGVVVGGNRLLNEQLDYNREALLARVNENCAKFNDGQRRVYDAVMGSVNGESKVFFLHSAGGCGKTFVCNTIAAAARAQGKIVLCVASSGIASLLLEGGKTAHSTFKIPIQVNETSTCNINRRSFMFEVIKQASIIIWDEVPMQHKFAIDAVDRTIKDILDTRDKTFGGLTVLFGGDFRQTLPVIPHGTRQQIVAASIRRSGIWQHVNMLYLHQNMRLEQSPEMQEFSNWLLNVGAGTGLDESDTISIPQHMICDDLVSEIYPGIRDGWKEDQYFLDRSILACTNDSVMMINSEILNLFPGEERTLLSADSVVLEDAAENEYQPYSIEYLNSLVSTSLPLAHLKLKVGCPIMLLRNLDASKGLCNGTRLRVLQIRRRVLKCKIISGDRRFSGIDVFIPRITLSATAEDLAIPLQRRQFPVRLAFAMTVNKSQGQSLKHVGLDLTGPVFSHGQLYVGLSRCTSGQRVKVLLKEVDNGRTANVVYREILTGLNL